MISNISQLVLGRPSKSGEETLLLLKKKNIRKLKDKSMLRLAMDSMKETYTTGRTDFTAASQETVIGEKDCRKFEKNQNFVRCRKRKQNAMK